MSKRGKRILVWCFLFYVGTVQAQMPAYVFQQLTVKDGLSEGTVRCIMQDNRGFMWFGTEDGLNRYDGYKFTVYKTNSTDSFSISNNNIKFFFNDKEGRLWVGTRYGMNIYDPLLDRFYNYNTHTFKVLNHIKGDMEAMVQDSKGVYWAIATGGGALYRFTSLDEVPQKFYWPMKDEADLFLTMEIGEEDQLFIGTHDGLLSFDQEHEEFKDLRGKYGRGYHVTDILFANSHVAWLATSKGLKKVDFQTGQIKAYVHESENPQSINGDNTEHLLWDNKKILIGVDGAGVDVFDPSSERFSHNSKEYGSQLNSNNVTSVYKDSRGVLWVGTFMNGVNFSNQATNFFVHVTNGTASQLSVRNGIVTSFLKNRGDLWVTTDGGGLNLKRKGALSFENFTTNTPQTLVGSNSVITSMEDTEGSIWVTTYGGGVSKIDQDGKAIFFRHDPHNPFSLGWDRVKAIVEYKGQMWFSTHGMGLTVLDKVTGRFHHYHHDHFDPNSLLYDWSYCMLKDKRDVLWIATLEGFGKYIPEKDHFVNYKSPIPERNNVVVLYEDSRNNFWLGTDGGGLLLFDREKETFMAYTKQNGLSDNSIKSIKEDNLGNLWLATNNGITKFNIVTRMAMAYTMLDGLSTTSFFNASTYKDDQGKIYFGANDGYLVIDPALSSESRSYPKVFITEMKLFGTVLEPNKPNGLLDKHIVEAASIQLDYNQNSISLEFAALNFRIPKHNHYAYRLKGFEEEWNYSVSDRIAKYTNLDPGTYDFQVKASNNGQVWGNKATHFRIVIVPPFWRTSWFLILCGIVGISCILFLFYMRTRAIRQRNQWLALQVEERTLQLKEVNTLLAEEKDHVVEQSKKILQQRSELVERKEELESINERLLEWNEFQNKLIAVVSHDIRGPLQNFSLLLQFEDEASAGWVKSRLKETANALSILATDLLSWVSLQSQKGELEYSVFKWSDIVEKALKQLESVAHTKQVTFRVTKSAHDLVKGVPPMALACLRNVISNSIRFSPEGGVVEIESGMVREGFVGIRITDHGEGFDPQRVNTIIQGAAFAGMKDYALAESAGLGMAICYDMIKRTGGTLEAVSLPSSGATFFIYLPIAIA